MSSLFCYASESFSLLFCQWMRITFAFFKVYRHQNMHSMLRRYQQDFIHFTIHNFYRAKTTHPLGTALQELHDGRLCQVIQLPGGQQERRSFNVRLDSEQPQRLDIVGFGLLCQIAVNGLCQWTWADRQLVQGGR